MFRIQATAVLLVLFITLLLLLGIGAAQAEDALAQGFQSPPPECRPDVYMSWMGGMVSREGLTKDLEALKREGVGGMLMLQVPDQVAGIVQWPYRDYPGKIKCYTDEWFAMVNHAIGECDRLGLTFSAVACAGWSHVGGPWVTGEKAVKILAVGRRVVQGPGCFEDVIPRAEAFYERKPLLPPWSADAEAWRKRKESYGDYYRDVAVVALPAVESGQVVLPEKILDLTGKMDDQGHLRWDVPAGTWTVLRLGCAAFNGPNYPAPVEGAGLESDRMNPAATRLVLDKMLGRIAREARARGYRSFKGFDTDSYESGFQDFGEDFIAEFEERMGYDCTIWLPAWHDKRLVIGSVELTGRFRRDMLQVISELWLERFYAEIRRFADAEALQWMIEPYFLLNIDWRTVASRAHLPGGEIWIRERPGHADFFIRDLIGPAPDAAALYGHKIVWAESYTAGSENSAWRNDPWLLKSYSDTAFCRGINHLVMWIFCHNPFGDHLQPGLSTGYWGTQLGRNVTWWPYSAAWHCYLARCQFLLRQGLPVADVLVYPPRVEAVPSPVLECAPYKQTVSNEEVLLERLSVKDGRLVLPHGVSYAALAIPPYKDMPDQRRITPQALRRILELVKEGATLIGEPVPSRSVSMKNYPDCDREMAALIAEIWGHTNVAKQGERRLEEGRVIWGYPLTDVLDEVAGGPDFEFVGVATVPPKDDQRPRYDFFHRHTPDAEIYFVANARNDPLEAVANFRVTGQRPELWDPVTGQMRPLPQYEEVKGRTMIPMRLDSQQSVFIVFPKKSGGREPAKGKVNVPAARPLARLDGSWQVAFDPKWGGPEQIEFTSLEDWTKRPEEGIKYYSGTAAYTKTFDAPRAALDGRKAVYLLTFRTSV